MYPSILILTREKLINNRAVINSLWCRILPKNNVKVIWAVESELIDNNPIKKEKNLFLIRYPSFKKNVFISTFISFLTKLRVANLLAREKIINQIQVRNGITDGLICLLINFIYGIPYSFHLSSLHGFEDDELIMSQRGIQKSKFKLIILFYPIFYSFLLSRASMIQPISKEMGEYLVRKRVSKANKIFPLPICSTINEINLKKKKVLSDKPIVVYAGSLGAERDINFMLEVFRLVLLEKPEVKFRIVGILQSNKQIEALENTLSNMNIRESVELFLNVLPRKAIDLISGCDVGVSPIKPNRKYKVSTPTKNIEYLSLGLPVVCNNEIYDHKHVITNSGAGFCVPYDVESFKRSIFNLLDNKIMFSKMSEKGKLWIYNNRTYDYLAPKLVEKYNDILLN